MKLKTKVIAKGGVNIIQLAHPEATGALTTNLPIGQIVNVSIGSLVIEGQKPEEPKAPAQSETPAQPEATAEPAAQ